METNEFRRLFNNGADVVYNSKKSAEILKAFNEAISMLYYLGCEERYIFDVLNTSSYIEEEYKRLWKGIGVELQEVADTLEVARSLLFGDCFNWRKIQSELNKIPAGDEVEELKVEHLKK